MELFYSCKLILRKITKNLEAKKGGKVNCEALQMIKLVQ